MRRLANHIGQRKYAHSAVRATSRRSVTATFAVDFALLLLLGLPIIPVLRERGTGLLPLVFGAEVFFLIEVEESSSDSDTKGKGSSISSRFRSRSTPFAITDSRGKDARS